MFEVGEEVEAITVNCANFFKFFLVLSFCVVVGRAEEFWAFIQPQPLVGGGRARLSGGAVE